MICRNQWERERKEFVNERNKFDAEKKKFEMEKKFFENKVPTPADEEDQSGSSEDDMNETDVDNLDEVVAEDDLKYVRAIGVC